MHILYPRNAPLTPRMLLTQMLLNATVRRNHTLQALHECHSQIPVSHCRVVISQQPLSDDVSQMSQRTSVSSVEEISHHFALCRMTPSHPRTGADVFNVVCHSTSSHHPDMSFRRYVFACSSTKGCQKAENDCEGVERSGWSTVVESGKAVGSGLICAVSRCMTISCSTDLTGVAGCGCPRFLRYDSAEMKRGARFDQCLRSSASFALTEREAVSRLAEYPNTFDM